MLIYTNKRSFYIRKEFNSHRVVLVHQHGGDELDGERKVSFSSG